MLRGFNHVGISVSNLQRSIEFYRNGLGMEVAFHGTFDPEKYAGIYAKIMRLEAPSGKVALLKADNVQLELFEFDQPAPRRGDPDRPVCDHGITHFCIEVDDIESEYARLKAAGAVFHCPPQNFQDRALATYARDPDGNIFELLELLKN